MKSSPNAHKACLAQEKPSKGTFGRLTVDVVDAVGVDEAVGEEVLLVLNNDAVDGQAFLLARILYLFCNDKQNIMFGDTCTIKSGRHVIINKDFDGWEARGRSGG